MPFPTTPIIDAMGRTENPLSNGGKWTIGVTDNDGAGGVVKDDGTTAVSTVDGTQSQAWWNAARFGDSESYGTINTSGTSAWSFYIRMTIVNHASNVLGYEAFYDNVNIYLVSNDAGFTQTVRAQVALTGLTAGDVLGIDALGTVLRGYRNGSVVATYDTASDPAKYSSGNVGFLVTKGVAGTGVSNFGGGNVQVTAVASAYALPILGRGAC